MLLYDADFLLSNVTRIKTRMPRVASPDLFLLFPHDTIFFFPINLSFVNLAKTFHEKHPNQDETIDRHSNQRPSYYVAPPCHPLTVIFVSLCKVLTDRKSLLLLFDMPLTKTSQIQTELLNRKSSNVILKLYIH